MPRFVYHFNDSMTFAMCNPHYTGIASAFTQAIEVGAMRTLTLAAAIATITCLGMTLPASAQLAPMTPDITGKKFVAPLPARDFNKREVMIPMRDGVKLYTVIMIPKPLKLRTLNPGLARSAPKVLCRMKKRKHVPRRFPW